MFIKLSRYQLQQPDRVYDVWQSLGQRECQEDRFASCALDNGLLFIVADGHAGAACAEYSVLQLPALFRQTLDAAYQQRSITLPDDVMRDALYSALRQLIADAEHFADGCTLSVAFVEHGRNSVDNTTVLKDAVRITVAQLGDSVVAECSATDTLRLTPSHSVFNAPHDVAAIKRKYDQRYGRDCHCRGGYIFSSENGKDGLSVTRGLGDRAFVLLREPTMLTWHAAPGSRLILASYGVVDNPYDPSRSIVKLFSALSDGINQESLAELLQSTDNKTLIYCKL